MKKEYVALYLICFTICVISGKLMADYWTHGQYLKVFFTLVITMAANMGLYLWLEAPEPNSEKK